MVSSAKGSSRSNVTCRMNGEFIVRFYGKSGSSDQVMFIKTYARSILMNVPELLYKPPSMYEEKRREKFASLKKNVF